MTEDLKQRLVSLASVFLKLGVIGFGGPAAHIAMMEAEIVTDRQWLERSQFLDLLGATNLIPGPNSKTNPKRFAPGVSECSGP